VPFFDRTNNVRAGDCCGVAAEMLLAATAVTRPYANATAAGDANRRWTENYVI
jgi:hypothetical protein